MYVGPAHCPDENITIVSSRPPPIHVKSKRARCRRRLPPSAAGPGWLLGRRIAPTRRLAEGRGRTCDKFMKGRDVEWDRIGEKVWGMCVGGKKTLPSPPRSIEGHDNGWGWIGYAACGCVRASGDGEQRRPRSVETNRKQPKPKSKRHRAGCPYQSCLSSNFLPSIENPRPGADIYLALWCTPLLYRKAAARSRSRSPSD